MKNPAGFFNFILTIPGYKVYSWLPKSLFAVSNANDYAGSIRTPVHFRVKSMTRGTSISVHLLRVVSPSFCIQKCQSSGKFCKFIQFTVPV